MIFELLVLTALAGEPAVAPDAALVRELGGRMMSLMVREPALKTLVDEAIAKSKSSSIVDYLGKIRYCDPMRGQYAAVLQNSEYKITYLGRVLEEPEPAADQEGLKRFYRERFKGSLVETSETQWNFEPDLIKVVTQQSQRDICIKPGAHLEAAADALAHETYHYVKLPETREQSDILSYTNLDEYAAKTVLAPGEEVDAYLFQYGMAIRREGKVVLGRSSSLTTLFSATGELTGRREDLVPYVLDELGYRTKRFQDEYASLLEDQLKRAEQRRQILAEVMKNRLAQQTELQQQLAGRNRLLGFVWPAYRAESERIARFVNAARESQARVKSALEEADGRILALQKRR